jgi:hypothetical protein
LQITCVREKERDNNQFFARNFLLRCGLLLCRKITALCAEIAEPESRRESLESGSSPYRSTGLRHDRRLIP